MFPQLQELEFENYSALGDYGSLNHIFFISFRCEAYLRQGEIWELRMEGCNMEGRAEVEVLFKK